MIVYQTDETGYFLGPTEADESPLEPGQYLIPRGAVEPAPPALNPGERARWTGAAWEVEAPPAEPEPVALTLDEQKAARLVDLAARRYQAEEAGTIFGGAPLATDRTTQGKITAAYVKAAADPAYSIPVWKFGPGKFAALDAATILAAADAVSAHVQACFTREADLSAAILGATDAAALAAVDIETGWPA